MFHASLLYTGSNLECLIWKKILQVIQTLRPLLFQILKLLLLYNLFIFFHVKQMPRSDNARKLSPLRKSILFTRLSFSLCLSNVLLFSEFINIVLIILLILVNYCRPVETGGGGGWGFFWLKLTFHQFTIIVKRKKEPKHINHRKFLKNYQ